VIYKHLKIDVSVVDAWRSLFIIVGLFMMCGLSTDIIYYSLRSYLYATFTFWNSSKNWLI